ncbi:calcium-activated chloride channel-domain-containing protein [Pavlovales sp. CCMP2436]|nr:calcium-activated chloride channel-domain-containing protein [Pavlovales sp. CCMP2436]
MSRLVVAPTASASELGRALAALLQYEASASGLRVRPLAAEGAEGLWAVEASFDQLVAEAAAVGVAKPALDPALGHFSVSPASLHLLATPSGRLFTPSERVMLAVSLLNRPVLSEAHLSRLPARSSWDAQAVCAVGSSICGACEAVGGASVIAPHEQKRFAALQAQWLHPKRDWLQGGLLAALTWQPHNSIRAYYGPTEISFYFDFLGCLTRSLVLPAAGALGLAGCELVLRATLPLARAQAVAHGLTAAYAAGLIVWSAVFIKEWKAQEKRRSLAWGTLTAADATEGGSELAAPPRLGFTSSEWVFHPLADRRRALRYALTVPVTLLCLLAVGLVMWLWLWAYYAAAARWNGGTFSELLLKQIPTVGYCASVAVLSAVYRPIARTLTNYENYRTAEAHRNALIAKRVLFELANNYSTLFYMAFCIPNNMGIGTGRFYLI